MNLVTLYYKEEVMSVLQRIFQLDYVDSGYNGFYMLTSKYNQNRSTTIGRARLYYLGIDFGVFEKTCLEKYGKKFKIYGDYQIYEFKGVKRTLESKDLLYELLYEQYCNEELPETIVKLMNIRPRIRRKVI